MPKDLLVLKSMTADLEAYLLAETLFWQMGGPSDFPALSLGGYWLARTRLESLPGQQPERDALNQRGDTILAKWAVAAENKAARELRSRLNLWRAYLEECRDAPRACAERYRNDVAQRVMAALLLRRFPRLADSAEAQRLPPLDAQLRARFKPGAFVWSAELMPAFPPDEFWFLYGQPQT
jgi:hypothetical protein